MINQDNNTIISIVLLFLIHKQNQFDVDDDNNDDIDYKVFVNLSSDILLLDFIFN